MSSEVDICNNALGELGAQPIMNLTDANDKARYCNRFYSNSRDWLLRKYDWNFAANKATLALLATPPAYDYDHAYQLPTLPYCLAVRELYEQRPTQGGYDFRIIGRTIETSADAAHIRYTARITDPTQFDAMFETALQRILIVRLCVPLGKSSAAKQLAMQDFKDSITEAEEANAIEHYQASTEDGKIIEDEGDWIGDR